MILEKLIGQFMFKLGNDSNASNKATTKETTNENIFLSVLLLVIGCLSLASLTAQAKKEVLLACCNPLQIR